MPILMCPPTHFGVVYEINPWMDVRRQADRQLAFAQWRQLRRLLDQLAPGDVLTVTAPPT